MSKEEMEEIFVENILHRIDKVKEELDDMIERNHENKLSDDIMKLSTYLDKLIFIYMTSKKGMREMNNDDSNLKLEIQEIEELRNQLQGKNTPYRYLFENHNSVMLIIDPSTGRIINANRAAIKYYGYSKDAFLNMNIHNINTLNASELNEEMIRAKTQNRSYFQFIHRLSNNELREVEVHSFPIVIQNKHLLFSTIYDISNKSKQRLMFDTLFSDSPFAVAILNEDQKVVNINKHFSKLFQYSLPEIKEKGIHLVSTSTSKTQIDNNIKLTYGGEVVKQEGIRKRKNGELVPVEILGYPIISHTEVIGVYVIYIDISEKKFHERQLGLFQNILENNSEGVVITSITGEVQWANNAFHSITGYLPSEMKGKKISLWKSAIQNKDFYKDIINGLSVRGSWSGEIWNKHKKGNIYVGWLTINSIKNDSGVTTHYVGIFKDLSDKKKIDRRIKELQQKDLLTGLSNRNYFLQTVDSFISKQSEKEVEFSIIIIDIEDFKEINNSVGHHIGDKLLLNISQRLLSRIKDNYLSRFTSGEFAILCRSISKEKIVEYTQFLLQSLNKPFLLDNILLHVSVNIGISRFPSNGRDAETLVQNADIAVYKAKQQLEKQICFYNTTISKEIDYKFLIANHLAEATINQELTICYQPIFDINNQSTIMGAEALIRWKNSVLGEVSPNDFIPIAEKTGQILTIGKWVFSQVCKQISKWQSTLNRIVPISVNISVKQLEQVGFASSVIDIINNNKILAHYIELEITESVSSGDIYTIVKNLKELKKHGFKIAMDDFGTGYSSLGQLDIFELDKIKIDKVFIDDLVHVTKRQNLVKSIVAMAQSLELVVVAEGIETKDQLTYLQRMGCQLGQGYLFSKPISDEEFRVLLDR